MLDFIKFRTASFVPCLIFVLYTIYLLTALIIPSIEKPVAGLLLLLGWIGLYRIKAYHYALNASEKYIISSFALFSVVSIISFLIMPKSRVGQMHLEDYGVFLMIIPLYFLMRQFRLNVTLLLLVFSIVLIGLGVQSYLSTSIRPSGGVNPMRFANITLIMSLFLVVALWVFKTQGRKYKVLFVLAILCGLFACIMAQSRGALLSIPVLVFVISVYLYRKGDLRLFYVVVLSGVALSIFLSQQPRIQQTFSSIDRYIQGDAKTAVGARFDMFKAAGILIKERPVFGHGLGSYAAEASKIRERTPGMNHEVGRWNNPHNEILLVMVEKGIIGLLTLIFIFFAPAYYFICALRRWVGCENNSIIRFYAISGLGLLLVYSVAGQSVALFEHDVFNHFYILMIVLFASQIRAQEQALALDRLSDSAPEFK